MSVFKPGEIHLRPIDENDKTMLAVSVWNTTDPIKRKYLMSMYEDSLHDEFEEIKKQNKEYWQKNDKRM